MSGGESVAAGAPEDVVKVGRSYTGSFLKPVLGRKGERGGRKGSRRWSRTSISQQSL
jgi:excinuclease ABC subunit A